MNGVKYILKSSKNPVFRCSILKVNDSYLTLCKYSTSVSKKASNDQLTNKSSDSLPSETDNLPVKKRSLTPFVGSTSVGEFVTARSDDLINWARKGNFK